MKKLLSILAVSVFAFSANAGTLDDVKNRGFLKCGVTTGLEVCLQHRKKTHI